MDFENKIDNIGCFVVSYGWKGGEAMISERGKRILAENMKRIRKERVLTQEELGNKVGISGVAIMRYEKGQREAKLETVEKIASALGVTAFDLMGIEYFDLKSPDAGRQYAEYDGFYNYLSSMGYSIKEVPDKGSNEEGVLSCSYAISGNGLDLILSPEEYTQLQASSGDLIFSYLWKKQNKK